jgi:ribosomal protein L29
MMTTAEIKKLSVAELVKKLAEAKNEKAEIGLKLRSNESHDQKNYHNNKKLIAQINTELRERELTNESN